MTAAAVVAPASRIDAVAHLARLVDVVAALAADEHTQAIVRQARCDLHAIGVTSEELDAAGIR